MNLRGLFNAKFIRLKEKYRFYLPQSWEDNGVHTFPQGYLSERERNGANSFKMIPQSSALTIAPRAFVKYTR